MLGILLLPYRCDRCGYRFWRWRWLTPFPESDVPESLWTSARFGVPLALAIVAVSVTLVVVRRSRPQPAGDPNTADRSLAVESQIAEPDRLAKGQEPKEPRASGLRPAGGPTSTAAGQAVERNVAIPGAHLRSQTRVAVVAVTEAAALRLRRRSRSVGELIRQGSAFSVPNGTAIAILERKDGLVRVRILESALAGRDGWAQPAQVATK